MSNSATTTPPGTRVAWVTGAGSGVGAAAAVRLAGDGFQVALSGRRAEALEATSALTRDHGGASAIFPLDVTDRAGTRDVHDRIVADLGPVSCLVVASGLNTPRRYWADMDLDEFERIVDTNLTAPGQLSRLVLDDMRGLGGGTIVIVGSFSGWRHSPDAGVAYSASKQGVGALVEHLNTHEHRHGIRATNIVPGDIDTDFLAMRPVVPDGEARKQMLSPDDVARTIAFVAGLPPHVCVDELVVTPVKRES